MSAKVKVTHCSNCPAGRYFEKEAFSYNGYMCHIDPADVKCVIYTIESADDLPLPADCPLRDGDVVIGL
jgi:hypothetical protein